MPQFLVITNSWIQWSIQLPAQDPQQVQEVVPGFWISAHRPNDTLLRCLLGLLSYLPAFDETGFANSGWSRKLALDFSALGAGIPVAVPLESFKSSVTDRVNVLAKGLHLHHRSATISAQQRC